MEKRKVELLKQKETQEEKKEPMRYNDEASINYFKSSKCFFSLSASEQNRFDKEPYI